ncbi:transglycosylase domain-containing protein [Allorhizocola rhizosphaerae]|uniref:transglycosylase domain-containing protein n=1 Tax=Allorhizocola rhizosphaerae TaxID=1872709 RepID=UPI000E3BFC52|nr:transglycosylase domain-containing protein [Allorhizocola rhizosphaerae]
MVGEFFERIPQVLRAGLLAGLVMGIVLAPLGIALGMAAKEGSEKWLSVPNNLADVPAGQTSYVYGADNQTLLAMFYEEHRRYLKINEIPQHLQHAVIAAEDSRFFQHNGVDVKGMARAFVANQKAGEVEQGASTLTMQYVRMALRDSARTPNEVIEATEQTTRRKVREVRIALEIEKRLSKPEILERYLNTAYFGHRAYGVFAAAEIYLSKAPAQVTLAESAMLAGLVKAPTDYDPAAQDSAAAKDRRDWVLTQMADQKLVTPEEAEAAKREPLALKVYDPPRDCVAAHDGWGFFCDFFKSWWMRQEAFGANPNERLDKLLRSGYRIVTTLDPAIQTIARNEIASKEKEDSVFAHGVVAIEPGTGKVKAMAVNRKYSVDQSGNGPHTDPAKASAIPGNYPNTVNPLLGGGDMPGYQAGSTFKLFTLVAALEAGMPLTTSYHAPHRYVSIYLNDPGSPSSCGDRWCPVNANASMTGTHTMWSGFGKSVNTYFVQLEQAVGAEKAVRMAERLGLKWRSETDKMMASPERADGWGSFTLGVADTTPLEMANAIATVAADGKYCEPLPVESITAQDGGAVSFGNKCHQAIPESVARAATDAARCVTGYKAAGGDCGDWSTASGVYPAVGRPVAGKTGTTDDTRAAWFIGFTPQLAAASFIADPDNPFNVVGDGQSHKPIQTVSTVLRDGLAGQPAKDFTYP